MKFTVTMECEGCGQKFVGQAEHLVDAVGHLVMSATEGDHAGGPLNQELGALASKAQDVNAVSEVLGALGLEEGQVVVMDKTELIEHLKKREKPDDD